MQSGLRRTYGWASQVGRRKQGRFADITVSGDPPTDVTGMERVTFVMKGGAS